MKLNNLLNHLKKPYRELLEKYKLNKEVKYFEVQKFLEENNINISPEKYQKLEKKIKKIEEKSNKNLISAIIKGGKSSIWNKAELKRSLKSEDNPYFCIVAPNLAKTLKNNGFTKLEIEELKFL